MKAGGTTCWFYELPLGGDDRPETLEVPYKDGSGRVFATVTWQFEKNPLCRMPPLAWFVSHVATVSLGVARAALDEATEGAQ
jgi:hypothetical protein